MPELKCREIKPGVFLNELEDERFKKQRLSCSFLIPLSKENITESALLPFLLERSAAGCCEPALLQRKLMKLYGASYSWNAQKAAYARQLLCTFEGVRGSFLPDPDIENEYYDFLISSILSPDAPDGSFRQDATAIEADKLRQQIDCEKNDKRFYSLNLAFSDFFLGDPRGLNNSGYINDLDSASPASLGALYYQFLNRGRTEIFAVNCSGIAQKLEPLPARTPKPIPPTHAVPYRDKPSRVFAPDDVAQDSVTLLFTGARELTRRERACLRIGSALYGGTATSRLFMNVREKQGLCYYCQSSPDLTGCALCVSTGVAHENAALAEESVLRELDSLCASIGKKELSETKLALRNAFLGIDDSVGALTSWYSGEIIAGLTPYSPIEEMQLSDSITDEEVRHVMSLFRLSTVSRVGRKD